MISYQEIGLTAEAHTFLTANAIDEPASVCPKCGHVISRRLKAFVYDECEIENYEGPTLREFSLKDGRIAKEVVQTVRWSSGPMVFMCLEISTNGKSWERVYEWTDEEMVRY